MILYSGIIAYRYLNLPDCTPKPTVSRIAKHQHPSRWVSFKNVVIVAAVYECPGHKSRSMGTLIIVTSFTTSSTGPDCKTIYLEIKMPLRNPPSQPLYRIGQ